MKRRDATYTHCYCEENVYKFLESFALKMEIARRRRTPTSSSSPAPPSPLRDDSEQPVNVVGNAPSIIDVDPSQASAACAVFISSYHDDVGREKKNNWESRVPICTVDVAGLVSDGTCPTAVLLPNQDPFVVWDYHVVAMIFHAAHRSWYIVDFDSSVGQAPAPVHPDSPLVGVRADLYVQVSLFPSADVHRRVTRQNVAILAKLAERVYLRPVDALAYLESFRSDRSHMLRSANKKKAATACVPGDYNAPPPSYPCILEPSPMVDVLRPKAGLLQQDGVEPPASPSTLRGVDSNLASFINMSNASTVPGTPMQRDGFLDWVKQSAALS